MEGSSALDRKPKEESRPSVEKTDPHLELVKSVDDSLDFDIEIGEYEPTQTDPLPEHRVGSAHFSETQFQHVPKSIYFEILGQSVADLAREYVQTNSLLADKDPKKLSDLAIRTNVFYMAKKEALNRMIDYAQETGMDETTQEQEEDSLSFAIAADLEMSDVRTAIAQAVSDSISDMPTDDKTLQESIDPPNNVYSLEDARQAKAQTTAQRPRGMVDKIRQSTDKLLKKVRTIVNFRK